MFTWLCCSPAIDAGSKIDLAARNLTLSWNNFLGEKGTAGKNVGSPYEYKLSQVDYTGHINPKHMIEGVITQNNVNSIGSLVLTLPRLASFAMMGNVGSPSWFYDDRHIINTGGSICVVLDSFTSTRDSTGGTTSGLGDILKYSMILYETSRW